MDYEIALRELIDSMTASIMAGYKRLALLTDPKSIEHQMQCIKRTEKELKKYQADYDLLAV